MNKGMVKHQWPGLRVVRGGPRFTAKIGRGGMMGGLNIFGKGMEVNLMGMDMPLPWNRSEEERRRSLDAGGMGLAVVRAGDGAGGTRPPSYVGYPPSYAECIGGDIGLPMERTEGVDASDVANGRDES